ncbi:MAG TPA: transposase [Polaromonas sp.]|nr:MULTISPECIES: transposase [unclassified Polaromonas]HQS86355.1 transposase [Polaromonas sp.]HQT06506.1 transposase [Polaromonas sp.]
MASEAHANRPKRRVYSTEIKTRIAQECRQPGASVAGVALAHGINANIVHRWACAGCSCSRWSMP